jgi:2-polyprenyl-3-methyl-5-hydroxy-6-metoxy-1,4-benzoquinol methylase
VPKAGRILELGCGHGVFSMLAAMESPSRSVLGLDVDEAKIGHARIAAARARQRGADVAVAVAPGGEVPDGPWNGIVVVDVLYLLTRDQQQQTLQNCARRLAPGGVLAVKEMALVPRWKARWNTLQETLAVKLLGITEGEALTFLPPAQLGEWMEEEGLSVRHLSLDRRYPHPHHLIVGRRAG